MASIQNLYLQLRPAAQYATKQWLRERHNKLSVRARNCAPGVDNIERALSFFNSVGSDHELLSIKNCGAKTLLEIKEFLHDLRHYITTISELEASTPDSGIAGPNEKQTYDILEEFPFLTLEESKEIANHMASGAEFPFLHLITKYIKSIYTTDRNVEIICRRYAVLPDSQPEQMDTLADNYGMTRERVRQIINKGIRLPERLNAEMNRHVASRLNKINSLELPIWKELSDRYTLHSTPREVAVLTCAVLSNYTLIQLEPEDYEYIICRDILKNSTLKTAFAKLKLTLMQRRTETEEISIMEYLCNGDKKYHPGYNLLKSIIASFVRRNLALEVVDDDLIIATPNKIDNFGAMENVLLKKGKPMSAEEMWKEFQQEYPNAGIRKFTSFKAYLITNPRILARGKTGTYAHCDWDHYFVGSIMEFVAHTITQRRQRISIEELIRLISHEYGEMSRNNLIAALRMDSNHEYVIYEDDTIGLRDAGLDDSGVNERKVYHRISFGQRMQSLKEFVTEYERLPFSNTDEEEATLSRWIYNMNHHKIDASDIEYSQYLDLMREYESLPQTRIEYRFKQKCLLIIDTLKDNGCNAEKLNAKDRSWIRKNIRERKNFAETDPRCRYIDELETHLDKIGYKI